MFARNTEAQPRLSQEGQTFAHDFEVAIMVAEHGFHSSHCLIRIAGSKGWPYDDVISVPVLGLQAIRHYAMALCLDEPSFGVDDQKRMVPLGLRATTSVPASLGEPNGPIGETRAVSQTNISRSRL